MWTATGTTISTWVPSGTTTAAPMPATWWSCWGAWSSAGPAERAFAPASTDVSDVSESRRRCATMRRPAWRPRVSERSGLGRRVQPDRTTTVSPKERTGWKSAVPPRRPPPAWPAGAVGDAGAGGPPGEGTVANESAAPPLDLDEKFARQLRYFAAAYASNSSSTPSGHPTASATHRVLRSSSKPDHLKTPAESQGSAGVFDSIDSGLALEMLDCRRSTVRVRPAHRATPTPEDPNAQRGLPAPDRGRRGRRA